EELCAADAGHALDFAEHVAVQIVTERDGIHGAIRRGQRHDQKEAGARFVDLHALTLHAVGKTRLDAAHTVLHLDSRLARIGAWREGDVDADRTGRRRGG